MADLSKLDNVFGTSGATPKPKSNTGKYNLSALDNVFPPSQPSPTPEVKPTETPVIAKQEEKPSIFKRAWDAYSRGVEKITGRPDESTMGTNAFINTLRYLPSEITETILPGVKAIRDNPELAATITTEDLVKALPEATLETAKGFAKAPITGATELPNLLTAGYLKPEIKFNVPFLGEVKNSDARIAERVANGEQPTLGMVIGEKSQGLMDALFFASLASKPFQARPTTIATGIKTPEGALPSGSKMGGPKSFRLYTGPKTTNTPIPQEALTNLEKSGVSFKNTYNPEYPSFFKVTDIGNGQLKGEIIQMRPSYFNVIKSKFSGDLTKANPAEVNTVYEQVTTPGNVVNGVKNMTPEQTIRNHIFEARDVVKETPDFVKANMGDFLTQTKTNIVDGLKAQGQISASNKINAIDISKMSSLTDLENTIASVFKLQPGKTVQIPVTPSIPKVDLTKLDNVLAPAKEEQVVEKPKVDLSKLENVLKSYPKNTPFGSAGKVIGKEDYAKELEGKKGIIVEENDPIINKFTFDTENEKVETIRALNSYNNDVRKDLPEGDILTKIESSYGKVVRYNVEDITKAKREIEIPSQEAKTAPETKDEVIHTLNNLPDGQEPPANRIEVPNTGTFNDFSYSPETNSVYKEVNNRWNEMKLEDDITGEYDFVNLRRLAKEDNLARFDKDIKSVGQSFAKEVYAIYKAKYGEYPVGFLTLSDNFLDWKNKKIVYDISQAETDKIQEYEATTINDILNDLHSLSNKGRSSEIIQSDIQYDVEGIRPKETTQKIVVRYGLETKKGDWLAFPTAEEAIKAKENDLQRVSKGYQAEFKSGVNILTTQGGNIDIKKYVIPKEKPQGLTLKPSEAKTDEEKFKEREISFGGKLSRPKTIVEKSDLKRIIDNSPEFKANPVLTVDEEKNLVFKGKDQQFKIKSEALGLNSNNLKAGDKIEVDVKALKAKGAEQQLRVYQGGTALADIGMFNNEIPVTAGKMENVNPIELPEMVQLAKELMGQTPKIKQKMGRKLGYFRSGGKGSITLKSDLFNPDVYTPDQVGKVLAHEIGHLVDYLPDEILARGNLLGRLLSLSNFRKNVFEDIMASNKQLRDEMYELSKEWRPFDAEKSSETYVKYRKSGSEIYADTISALFNNPGYVETKAPTFYKTFFEELDRKPDVRDAYFELQSLLSGDKELLTAKRREGVKQMFNEGEYKAGELQRKFFEEKKQRLKDMFARLKYDLVSKNYPIIDRVKQLEKQGVKINPDDNPLYYLEERNYLGGKIKAILSRDFDTIYRRLGDNGITWEDFGEALFYRRIIDGDRSKVANPRGITPEVAKTLYEDLTKKLGDKVNVLEESLTDFRTSVMKIAEEAYQEGLYKEEMYNAMKENPTYATFQVIDHLEEGLSSKVYKSIGTLKDITNPATATIEKMVKTIQAIERNKVTKATADFLLKNYPSDISEAKKVFSGKGQRFIESKKRDQELITFMRGGKAEGYYVDPYISESLNNESIGRNLAVVQSLKFMNSNLFRPLFITYNLGFQSFNLIRDFVRFWKNIPDISMWQAMKRYKQSFKIAKTRAFGLSENPSEADLEAQKLIEKLEFDRVFSTTMNDLALGETMEDKQIDRLLAKYGVNPAQNLNQNQFIIKSKKLLEVIRQTGDLIETLPKAAGYYELSSRGPITKEDASFIRRKIGSPDFLDGGYAKPITNEVFLFSNSILQGMRADLEVMTDPKTRGGYWWKTAKLTFLPKIIMFAAILGLFGKELKDLLDGVSEYDKTNYIIIPLGKDKNGKTVYVRLPQDETGRFFGGMFWKMLNASRNDQNIGKDITDIISYTGGQLPSVSPVIQSLSATMQYVSGQNPYDYFRGRNVLSDDSFNAGGWTAAKDFLGWQFQQMGGGIFGNFFSGSQTPVDKSIPEKVFTAPLVGNIIGRFVKVSNYGKTEEYKQIQAQYNQMSARQRLEEKDTAQKYAEMVSSKELSATDAAKQMIKDTFGGNPKSEDDIAKAKRLIGRFNINVVRGSQDPVVNAITYASSNKEKIAILKKAEENMDKNTYISMIRTLYNDNLIGETVLNGLSESK